MDLSSEQERYLHNILDKGIESLTEDEEPMQPGNRYAGKIPQETPTLPGLPASTVHSTTSTSRVLYADSPSLLSKTPLNLSFAESQSIQNEMMTLHEKVASLESRLHQPSPNRVQREVRAPRDPQRRSASRRSPSPSAERLFLEIEKSEKELERIERSTSKSPDRRSPSLHSSEISRLKSELAEERRRALALQHENEQLKQRLAQRDDLQLKLTQLQEDYNALSVSFDKSEVIRRKQKDLIEQLKREAEGESPAYAPYADTTKPSSSKGKKPATAKKTSKTGKSKLIYAD